jgi:O-acetyl-ADP-ribose deacetylase (regulator of RNase III)
VIDGDITNIAVDGVVSNDDVDGRMYTVIASSIKAAAGPDVERQSLAQGPFQRGDAWHTDAGTLPSPVKTVIHVAAMDRRGDTDRDTIVKCVSSALDEARTQGLRSVAIAAFGAGPRGPGPKVIEIQDWLADVGHATIARFCEWREEGDDETTGTQLKVLIVLYGTKNFEDMIVTLCDAAYEDDKRATPSIWPGIKRHPVPG